MAKWKQFQPMTTKERTSLDRCEVVIVRSLNLYAEVREAMRQIKDDQLYRDRYETFADYCRDRWGLEIE